LFGRIDPGSGGGASTGHLGASAVGVDLGFAVFFVAFDAFDAFDAFALFALFALFVFALSCAPPTDV